LLRLRSEAGLTQSQLAQASGVSLPQIARYERGESNPRMTALMKLSKALGVSVESLTEEQSYPAPVRLKLSVGKDEWSISVPQHLVNELNEIHTRLGGDETTYYLVLMMTGMRQNEDGVGRDWIESTYRLSMESEKKKKGGRMTSESDSADD